MIRLWGRASSINVQKVLWALEELQIPYERLDAGFRYGVVNTPEYAKLNPMRLVPTIEDDGLVLWESNVIVRYLAVSYGVGVLTEADPRRRAVQDQWMEWYSTTLAPDVSATFWAHVRNPPSKRDPADGAAKAEALGRRYQLLNDVLADRPYLGGEAFSMADIPAGATLWRYYTMPIVRPALPNVEAWYTRLQERPAYRTTVMTSYEELRGHD